jgi:hypothetical protein
MVLADPPEGVSEDQFIAWYADHHDRLAFWPGLSRIRHLVLNDEQLLPHRAARASHRFAAVYELEDSDALASVAARAHPTRGRNPSGGVDIARVQCAAFVQITDTVTAPQVGDDAPERPRQDAPPGPSGSFTAFTRPIKDEADHAYNRWYDEYHLPETLLLDGVTRGRRFKRVALPVSLAGCRSIQTPYLTYYDLDNVAAIPFDRDVLLDWLDKVGVDHLGPDAYDASFTQAFVHRDVSVLTAKR